MTKARGPRRLDPEDRALWEEVTKSVTPLRKRRAEPVSDEPQPRSASPSARKVSPKPPAVPASPSRSHPPLMNLDRRTRQRVARGSIAIDARLDLHGLTLERARTRLAAFLAGVQDGGAGLVLVITGKGGRGERERGALRRQVPLWLSLPEFRPLVIGFEEAAPAHGGAGALYVRVRRKRS